MEQIVTVPVLFLQVERVPQTWKTDRRWTDGQSECTRAFYICLCVAWTKSFRFYKGTWEASSHSHANKKCCNANSVAWRVAPFSLIPSCLCIQHSTAGPPPEKQMAGNNTVTHPEHWHPGPGLRHALCYLSVCIASEIPPLSSQTHQQIRRYTWVKLTGQLSLISQTYASIFTMNPFARGCLSATGGSAGWMLFWV